MSAQYKKWGEGERILLKDVLPLETPISVQIEPSSACNFRCKYCYQSNDEQSISNVNKIMKWEVFEKIINDLGQFPQRIKAITFARNGEPTLNKLLPEMVSFTKKSNVCEKIKIITNGSMLTPSLNMKLIDGGLDVLRISLQGITEQQYYETSGVNIDMEGFISNIQHFYHNKKDCQIYIKALDKIIKGNEKSFVEKFSKICDEIFIEHLIDFEIRENNINKNMMNEDFVQDIRVCSMPFYSINIASDGSILPCCGDYYNSLRFENVSTLNLKEYWEGKALKRFQILQLKGRRFENRTCKTCLVPTFSLQSSDIIDDSSQEIINKILNKQK